MLTMPVDAVGKTYDFTTKTLCPDGRGGAGLIQYTGKVLDMDQTCVRIREDPSNDILIIALDHLQCVREESAVKGGIAIAPPARRGH